MPDKVLTSKVVRRASLGRVVTLGCGCAIQFPTIKSHPSLREKLVALFARPRYLNRCNGAEGHRTLKELTG